MGKLTQTNQFNGGIIKDLHPIMTPNTVLTDCLNGTLITYNGNEFVLQNDMGNYSFTNGSLNRNFVPVGLKEYGGLLYIISYNPLENKVEIGTFPSQQTIWGTSDKANPTVLTSIELPSGTLIPYTKITSDIVLLSNDKDNTFYLSPGDKYILTYTKNSEENKYEDIINWQHLTLYALTDDNKLYNINNYINFRPASSSELSEDYEPISWEVPGWIAAKFDINTPTEFNAYFDSSELNLKSNENQEDIYTVTPSGTLKLKTIWDSSVYNDSQLEYLKNNLYYIFHTKKIEELNEEEKNYDIKHLDSEKLQYNDIQSIIFSIEKEELKYDYVTPALKVGNQYIVYNQFTSSIKQETYTIDATKIKLGEEYFKYYTDENSVTLYFDYKSYPGVSLGYNLYRFTDSDNPVYSKVTLGKEMKPVSTDEEESYYLWSDIDYNGSNIIDISFSTDSTIENPFDKEDIYVIVFSYLFKSSSNELYKKLGKTSKLLYVSDVTNYYYNSSSVFDFSGTDWAEHVNLVVGLTAPNIKNLLSGNYTNSVAVQKPGSTKFIIANNFEETSNSSNIKTYYGDAFTIIPSERDLSGIGYYKVINRYLLQDEKSGEKLFTLKLPVNQYGEVGRLWKKTKIKSVSKDTTILDSKGKSYTLSYDNENLQDAEIYFDVSELYKLEVSDYPLTKQVASEYKTINEFSTADTDSYLSKNNTVFFTENRNAVVRMAAWLQQECYGTYGSINERVLYIPSDFVMYATFVNNVLYWVFGDTEENKEMIKRIADGEASKEELDKCVYPNNVGPIVDPSSNYNIQLIRHHGMEPGDGWTDLGPMSNVARNIQPIGYCSWRENSVRIKNVGNMGTILNGLFMNSTDDKRPYFVQYSLGDNNLNNVRALFAAIMYYIRFATRVKDSTVYYPSISISKIEFNPFTTVMLNSKGELTWNYDFSDEGAENLIKSIKSIKEELDKDGVIYGKDSLSNTMYIYDQESTQILLENFANDINVFAKERYNADSSADDIEAQTFYVELGYDNETNPIHNLKEFAKLLRYERDRIRIVLDYSYYNDNDVAIRFFKMFSAWVICAFALNKYFN